MREMSITPRVTQIISVLSKPHLAFWRGSIGNERADQIMHESSHLGLRVHSHIENFHRNGKIPAIHSILQDKIVRLYADWWSHTPKRSIAIENRVVGFCPLVNVGYTGQPDNVYIDQLTDEQVLLDIKTSKNMSETFWMQTAAYTTALNEFHGFNIMRRVVVQVNGSGIQIHTAKNEIQDDFEMFQHCAALYKHCYRRGMIDDYGNLKSNRD